MRRCRYRRNDMTALSLEQQLARKCIHFNGVMNDSCKAGIKYNDVRGEGPMKFPCLQNGGFCESAKFPSPEEVKKRLDEIESAESKIIAAYTKIKAHYNKTKELSGTLTCECGGQLKYRVASSNEHIWAKCGDCGISFME